MRLFRRLRRPLALGAVALLVVAVTAWRASREEGVPRRGTRVGTLTGEALRSVDEPAAYDLRFDDGTRVQVHRPFNARRTSVSGVETATLGRQAWDTGEGPTGRHVGPGTPPGDARLVAALRHGVREEWFVLGERRAVPAIDRECQVYRTGGVDEHGVLAPVGTTEGTRVDFCLDVATGVVLEEARHAGGDLVLQRVAVAYDTDEAWSEATFRLEGAIPPPPEAAGGSFERAEDVTAEWEAEAPAGFGPARRYAVVTPDRVAGGSPTLPAARASSLAFVWTRGVDLVVFEAGRTPGGQKAFPAHAWGGSVETELGPAELLLTVYGSELRVDLGGGRFVRAYGTVGPDVLAALLDTARHVDAGSRPE